MVKFNTDYFKRHYSNYILQNPKRKINWYRWLLQKYLPADSSTISVCDIGCGGAAFIRALPLMWERFGVDPASDMLTAVKPVTNGAFLCGGALEQFPLKRTFDVVTLFDVLEHVPQLEAAGSIIENLLNPGGLLLFVVPVYDGPAGGVVRLLDKDPTHVHRVARSFWLEWVNSRFDLVQWYGVVRYFVANHYYVHLPTKMLRLWTPAIAIVARKR